MSGQSMATPAAHEKVQIVTPFQIFCHQEREKVAQMNPHLKGIAITSLLGRMWRNLSEPAKSYYNTLSFQLRGTCSEQSVPTAETPIEPVLSRLPAIAVVPRRRFGVTAANASMGLLASTP